ncbi:hypothetical protein L226DRAFT_538549 [Lentinus tigrinus ALCF2SS1-7]|nr:hypothetical protein L226DRAFT_538549 [Lentinus tigrinus ALCF2SS1-7]
MTLLSQLFSITHRFLGGGPRKDSLDRLPNAILLDIFSLLDVADVFGLRRVSKLYYQVTKDAALWRALLRRTDIPIPILPPTSRNTIDCMSVSEMERILVRARSIMRNWQSPHPKVFREWNFDTADYHILDMTLLPGGSHLITSACDRGDQQCSLIVWDLDVKGAPKMVVAIPTESKAYDIQAKYMSLNGVNSIVLVYLQRNYLFKNDLEAADLGLIPRASQLSTYYKIEAEFRYQCTAGYLPLENLQRYVDIPYPYGTSQHRAEMEKLPKAYNHLTKIATQGEVLSCPVLGVLFGDPHFLVVKGTNEIVFRRLLGSGFDTATLTCIDSPNYAQLPHTIKTIQLVPQEYTVFVVREVATQPPPRSRHPVYLFEVYAALRCSPFERTSQQQLPLTCHTEDSRYIGGDLTHIYVPEFPPYIHPAQLTSMPKRGPYAPYLRARFPPDPPLPICVYARSSRDPEHIVRITFEARRLVSHSPAPSRDAHTPDGGSRITPKRQTVYLHTLKSSRCVSRCPMYQPNGVIRIIPAATRPLVCLSSPDDRDAAPYITEVRPFIDRGWEAERYILDDFVRWPPPGSRLEAPRFGARAGNGGKGPGELGKRVVAFAWEESVGRLIVAEEGMHTLSVFDFADAPPQDTERNGVPGSSAAAASP